MIREYYLHRYRGNLFCEIKGIIGDCRKYPPATDLSYDITIYEDGYAEGFDLHGFFKVDNPLIHLWKDRKVLTKRQYAMGEI